MGKCILNDNNSSTILMSEIPENRTRWAMNIGEWTLNPLYDGTDDMIVLEPHKITIKKFYPNVWIAHSPIIGNCDAVCKYSQDNIVNISGLTANRSLFNSYYPTNNACGAGNDTPKMSGLALYPMMDDNRWFHRNGMYWEDGVADNVGIKHDAQGHNQYGYLTDKNETLVWPDTVSTLRINDNPNTWRSAIALFTGLFMSFRNLWWTSNRATISGNTCTIVNRYNPETNTGSGFCHISRDGTGARAMKIVVSGMQSEDILYYGPWKSTRENATTTITADGTYDLPDCGSATNTACFRLYGNTSTKNPVTITMISDITDENGAIDISANPIVIEEVSRWNPAPSEIEVWEMKNNSGTTIYHKDKTIKNCWKKYGLFSKTSLNSVDNSYKEYDIFSQLNMSEYPKCNVPEVTDLTDELLNEMCIVGLNTRKSWLWDKIYEKCESGYIDRSPDFGVFCFYCLFYKCQFPKSSLNINISTTDITNRYIDCENAFYGTNLEEININLGEHIVYQSFLNLFRNARYLKRFTITSTKTDTVFSPVSLAGTFERTYSLTTYPNIFKYGQHQYPNAGIQIQYCFNASGIQEMLQYGTDRYARDNTILVAVEPNAPETRQAFNSDSITKIGPVLDFRFVNPEKHDVFYTFGPFGNITDARIKNLNHGDWDLSESIDGDNNPGSLENLNQESVVYLINNLRDLKDKNTQDFFNDGYQDTMDIPEKDEATLTCSAKWKSFITADMVTAVKTKGWTIVCGGTAL